MNLFIYVEGQEEEMFVNRVLRNHLSQFGVVLQKPILAATSFRVEDAGSADVTVGGVTNYASIRADIVNLYEQGEILETDALTTFIDLYALPLDFPGQNEANAQSLKSVAKAARIEQAWKADINRPNFFPYIQVHEFEALILTRPSVLEGYYPESRNGIRRLGQDCSSFSSPEEINETRETSPSHRILHWLPSYQKIDGFRHLQEIGVAELKTHCQHFRAWLDQCENFPR